MYTKDKSQRITLRLNQEQFLYVKMNAEILDVSPSDFLRMVINSSLATWKASNPDYLEKLESINALMEGGLGRENDETSKYDQF